MTETSKLSPEDQGYLKKILELKAKWGRELIILAHHYQRAEVVGLNDFVGDSFQLAKNARDAEGAKYIVFCGVRFMAEAADILRRDSQVVIHPDERSGCPLADFAPADKAEDAWKAITAVRGDSDVMPLVYMNSTADLKAFVGAHGGSVCTSSNAPRAFEWGFENRPLVFFFPDEHLGRNTARGLSIDRDKVIVWDPEQPEGGLTKAQIENARVILWKGYCHVHTHFTPEMIKNMREKHPGARVVVHPECPEEVVLAADGAGSTSYLVKQVAETKPGDTLVIGTEINLVSRLATQNPDRTILPLARSLCPNMFRISLKRVLESVESLPNPEVVVVPEDVKRDARLALDRMLAL